MKLRSLSLSLDSLLDYTDKDIEESRFELSLVAESLYEMLYYNMGSRLFTFLQKLRSKFLIKRNQQKRQREESSKKISEDKPAKRAKKTDEHREDDKSTKTESHGKHDQKDEKLPVKEDAILLNNAEETVEPDENANESEMDEDPEEDPEEETEMQDTSPQDGQAKEAKENAEEMPKTDEEASEIKPNLESGSKEVSTKVEKNTKTEFNKELLQAFRFFDRNRAGYVRVEDMRLILHNLGKFLSHRDVKELVQSALIESNTGRDDRILYKKLIDMNL